MKRRMTIAITTLGLLLGLALWSAGLGAKAKGTAAAPAEAGTTAPWMNLMMTTPCSGVSFAPAVDFDAGNDVRSVAVGDFNLDGKPDLAIANGEPNVIGPDDPPGYVSVRLGNGMGGFGAKTDFQVGNEPLAVAVGDFNLDGKPDLAVANAVVSVLLGDGMGGFGSKKDFGVGSNPVSLVVEDLNLDGKPDLVTGNVFSRNASVLINNFTPNTAPVAVCRNVAVSAGAGCTASVTAAQLNNGSYDPDGDSISLSLNSTGPLVLGDNWVTLIVTDCKGASGSCSAKVTVVDQTPPTITLNGANPMTVECPYGFVDPGATATDNCAGSVAVIPSGSVNPVMPGSYTITYTANDGTNTATRTRTVNVVDTAAPTLTLKPDIQLWPPNHSYRTLTVSQMVESVSDACNSALSLNDVRIEKVTSDEPDNVKGGSDGETTGDILIAADCKSVQLRAERDEKKNGRVYVVTLRVRDASGNTTRKDFKVSVPINQSGAAAVPDAAALTRMSGCP